jgi:hypothetical protein
MSEVQHIPLGHTSMFTTGAVVATTPSAARETGPTTVLDVQRNWGDEVAYWGTNNLFPQKVITAKRKLGLVPAVIKRKVDMFLGSGIRYGRIEIDGNTGEERMIRMMIPEIETFLRDSAVKRYVREAANDWYTFANVFVEFTLGRGKDRITRITCQDASHVRLSRQDEKGEIRKAFLCDWQYSSDARELPALDPYSNPAKELMKHRHGHSILPIRDLVDGQFYYGVAPWHAMLDNGWIDLLVRIPELKLKLLSGLMNIRYHIEFDERYWSTKFKDWHGKDEKERISIMQKEVGLLDTWLSKQTHAGAYMSTMLAGQVGADQVHLVKINEFKLAMLEGAYIEDSQEGDFILCRDMGLKPSLHGISPSKSGSSPGSGSEDRVSRTNHILDARDDMDQILEPLRIVRDFNGWSPDIEFWTSNYYAATLDRTNQVDRKPNANPER